MREIKFRAWKGDERYMLSWRELKNYQNDISTIKKDYSIFDDGALNLIQYTGLKDKNGKEIYEGDALRVECFIDRDDGPGDDAIALVNFENGSFEADFEGCTEFLCCITDSYETEIIGNKFENPEMLENI